MPYADKNCEAAKISRRKASKRYYYNNRRKEIERCAKYNRENQEKVNRNAVIRRSVKLPVEVVLYRNAKNRAKAKGIPFDIEVEDIIVPNKCPILEIPLKVGVKNANDNSPSMDRIIPERGYVRGNIQVISHKANSIKNNASTEELKKLLEYMEGEKWLELQEG